MIKEFREFITRGNVIDLAVGIIIGAAFTKIVDSLVNDIIMPPLGIILGKVDFSNLFINLDSSKSVVSVAQAKTLGVATINYGIFINVIIQFLIIAFVIFLLVKGINRLRREKPADPTTQDCPFCYTEIPLKATRCPACTSDLKIEPSGTVTPVA